jgi:hypothetical protein
MPGNLGCRPAFAVRSFAPIEFALFPLRDRVDHLLIDSCHVEDIVIDDTYSPARDGSKREFLMSRDAEFADEENIERRVEIFGDLECYRNAAPRQREYDYVGVAAVNSQLLGQRASCVASISERH